MPFSVARRSPRAPWVSLSLVSLAVAVSGCGGGDGSTPAEANVASIPSLTQSLKLRDPAARARAAIALGRMGPAAKEAVPGLTAVLKDRDVSVRSAAAYALGRIGPDAKPALAALQGLTKQAATREVATEALERIGDAGP